MIAPKLCSSRPVLELLLLEYRFGAELHPPGRREPFAAQLCHLVISNCELGTAARTRFSSSNACTFTVTSMEPPPSRVVLYPEMGDAQSHQQLNLPYDWP